MKHIILINGTIGIGKSTISQMLMGMLEPSAYLDGEWCWIVRPPQENNPALLKNMAGILHTYLQSDSVENVILDWAMHNESVIDDLFAELADETFTLHKFTLVCSEDVLRGRLAHDITAGRRDAGVVATSVARMPLFEKMGTTKIDVGLCNDIDAARQIVAQVLIPQQQPSA